MIQPLTIKELVQLSGVSRRTIHFYIKEGLLPSPDGRGSAARYDPSCLSRLHLIPLLKEGSYMRLEGIREFMAPLTDAALQVEIERLERGGPQLGPDPAPSTLDMFVKSFAPIDEDQIGGALFTTDALNVPMRGRIDFKEDVNTQTDTDTWTRVRISDDVEIHYREGANQSRLAQFRHLITIAQKMLRRKR